jgi:hypothetical protein
VKIVWIVLAVVVAMAGVHRLQVSIDEQRSEGTAVRSLMHLPDGEVLKFVSLGYQNVVADLIWLRIIQVFGDRTVTEDGYNWIYNALDAVTTLDPQFVQAYLAGSMTLTVMADHVEQSNRILEKGIAADLEEWRIPFTLGFNYFNFLRDYRHAAKYVEMAATMPGTPDWLPLLAARLHVQADDPQLALEFITRVYEATTDEGLKVKLEIRIKEVMIERDLMAMKRAVERYQVRHGSRPERLSQLVETGILKHIPLEPFGGTYTLDSETTELSSSSRPERMKVYHPHQRKQDG